MNFCSPASPITAVSNTNTLLTIFLIYFLSFLHKILCFQAIWYWTVITWETNEYFSGSVKIEDKPIDIKLSRHLGKKQNYLWYEFFIRHCQLNLELRMSLCTMLRQQKTFSFTVKQCNCNCLTNPKKLSLHQLHLCASQDTLIQMKVTHFTISCLLLGSAIFSLGRARQLYL